MRVLHLITRMILGGAQENTLFTCEDLQARFHDEVLLATGPSLGPEGSLLERARARGVSIESIDSLRREIRPVSDVAAYRAIGKLIRAWRPDVVHTHSAKAGILGRLAAWHARVPAVVHTIHGNPFSAASGLGAMAIAGCERYAARRCHRLIGVADAMTELFVARRIAPREQLVTIYSGMEVEPFLQAASQRAAARAELGYAPEHVVIGKVARLFHLKGHADVLRAARRVVDRFPQARFLFIGDGLLRGELERQAVAAGLADHVRFLGLVSPERIPALLAATDLVVHASYREGLARVLPQALLSGRPAVSYDVDGAREVVRPGETGLLVSPGDLEGLATALETLTGDAALRSRYGENGVALCRDRFRHETMTTAIRREYERVLAR